MFINKSLNVIYEIYSKLIITKSCNFFFHTSFNNFYTSFVTSFLFFLTSNENKKTSYFNQFH